MKLKKKNKKQMKPEDEYPGIWNLRQKSKRECINHFIHEQSSIERETQKERSDKRNASMRKWFRDKMELLVDNSLVFFEDQEVHYTDHKKNG